MSTNAMKFIINDQYLKSSNTCPNVDCRSSDIKAGFVEIQEGKAVQGVQCNECNAQWNDEYELSTFTVTS